MLAKKDVVKVERDRMSVSFFTETDFIRKRKNGAEVSVLEFYVHTLL